LNYITLGKKLFWKSKSLPIYFIFFITNRCNAKCNHCFYWKKNSNKSSELSLQEIKKISTTIGPLYHINFTGGEPFLRDDLHKIVYTFYKNCKVRSAGIPTSGYNPDRICEAIKKIIRRCPDINLKVDVSLDHFNDTHDNMRNLPGLFNNAIQTIKTLKELNLKRLVVGVNVTLTKENERDIEKIYTFIRDVIQPDVIDPILIRGNPRDIKTKDVSFKSYNKLISLWTEDMRANKFRGYPGFRFGPMITARDIVLRKLIINKLRGKETHFRCLAGILGGVMYEDGEVFPCELLSEGLGNIRKYNYDFKKLWFSANAGKIRAKIRNEKCSCTHECFQNLNVLFSIKAMPLLLKEYIAKL